jgi:hypothetical protein
MDLGLTILNFRRLRLLLSSFIAVSAVAVAPYSLVYSKEAARKKFEAGSATKSSGEPNKGTPGISFSEQTLGEDGSLYVQTWFPNDSNNNLVEVNLEIFGPDFVEWRDTNCSGSLITHSLSLGASAPYSFVERQLCAKLKPHSEVKVGDFNILFVYKYRWKQGKILAKSVATVEKPLKIVLLGSDNIVGIPLGLAGLVLPGLFFWFAVSLWKTPWGVGLALGENLFYSLFVSAFFVELGTWLPCTSWLPHLDVLHGVTLGKLVRLAVTGMVAGTVAGGVDRGYRRWRRTRGQALTVKQEDTYDVKLEKLLRMYPNVSKPLTTVRLKDGTEYQGSLGVQIENMTHVVGWFAVSLSGFHGSLPRVIRSYAEKNRLPEILELARSKNVKVETRDSIQENGQEATGNESMGWQNDQVAELKIEPGRGPYEPLILT